MGLLASLDLEHKTVLIVGSVGSTGRRASSLALQGADVIVVGFGPADPLSYSAGVTYLQQPFEPKHIESLGRTEVDGVVDAVFVSLESDSPMLDLIVAQCRRLRVPVNVTDRPDLCSFTLLSTHTDGDLQIGITTNGKGCRLANRIKRHVVNTLPKNMAQGCETVGQLRRQILDQSHLYNHVARRPSAVGEHDDDAEQSSHLNQLAGTLDDKTKRMRWLTQVVEYYPLERLADLTMDDLMDRELEAGAESPGSKKLKGHISLVGSGPGSDLLLAPAALQAIQSADLVLADKLVPSPVLALVPKHTEIHIAKKFPGNAERAQQELLILGTQALDQGKHVVRVKQGDPYVFGRGAEEYLYFSERGYRVEVVAGISSALSAPLAAQIPVTHRGVADQVLICTGTGREGVLPNLPAWVPTRTCIFLMALHRIKDLVAALTSKDWTLDVPCAVIERANCPDQRVIRTTLEHVVEAIQDLGSRPPGLLVAGHACTVIKPLSGQKWVVE